MRLWHRIRDLFGLSSNDFAVEGDRVVFRVLDRARELPLEPSGGQAEIAACRRCGKPTKRVCFTTAGSGQAELWRKYPLAVDGWICACGWSAAPRRITAEEGMRFERTGIEHLHANQLDDAEFWFRRLLASWAGLPTALANLGALYVLRAEETEDEAGRAELRRTAEQFFVRALATEEHTPFGAAIELAKLQVLDDREQEAVEQLTRVIENDRVEEKTRDDARAFLEQLGEGRGLFTRATELAKPYLRYGTAPTAITGDGRERLKQARALLREASTRKRSFATSWILGKIEQALGNRESALTAFAEARESDPDQPDGCREYVLACLELGRASDAVAVARHAVEVAPSDMGLRSNLALVLLLAGDLDEASRVVGEALKADPADRITEALAGRIRAVREGRMPRPKTLAQLEGRE